MRTKLGIGTIRNIAFWKGTIQEVVLYDSSQKTNHANIETNINDQFSIYS